MNEICGWIKNGGKCRLEKENKQLKEQLEREIKVRDEIHNYLHNKINEQKHILDELEKWLEEIQQEEFDINGFTGVCTEIRIQCILDKLKELRGRE